MPADDAYRRTIDGAAKKLFPFLRAFEAIQERIQFDSVPLAQQQLRDAGGGLFATLPDEVASLTPPPGLEAFQREFVGAVGQCANAYTEFVDGPPGLQFGAAFVNSRWAFCRGLDALYGQRARLPALGPYWVLPDTRCEPDQLETRAQGLDVPVGLLHPKPTDEHAGYSLYVPEYYDEIRKWPLIICLHGGYGRGDEYIWTWLRAAKSRGYVLVSPKSSGPTWSVLRPQVDARSILAILEHVCGKYAIDTHRVYLSGLSDGGTYAYLLGLEHADRFAGIAPIAADFHPMIDPLLRQKRGRDLPLYVIHGARDAIFPVQSIRNGCQLLEHLGYAVTLNELPEWGHALTNTINESLVLPWFESLGRTSAVGADPTRSGADS